MHEEHTYTSPYIAHAYIKIRWPSILRHSLEDPHTHTLAILFGYSSRGRCASVYPCMLYGYSTRAQRLCIYTHIQNICSCVCVCVHSIGLVKQEKKILRHSSLHWRILLGITCCAGTGFPFHCRLLVLTLVKRKNGGLRRELASDASNGRKWHEIDGETRWDGWLSTHTTTTHKIYFSHSRRLDSR